MGELRLPYVGFSNETLATLPELHAGEWIPCPHCAQPHEVTAGMGGAQVLFYRCPWTDHTYLAGVGGKNVLGIEPDVSDQGGKRETQPLCQGCWHELHPHREPARLDLAFRKHEVCAGCGADTLSGIYALGPRADG